MIGEGEFENRSLGLQTQPGVLGKSNKIHYSKKLYEMNFYPVVKIG